MEYRSERTFLKYEISICGLGPDCPNMYYFVIEEPCTCSCGNEHLNSIYDSSEDDILEEKDRYYKTEQLAKEAAKNFINDI